MIYKFERKLKGANQVEATGEELTINNAGRKVQKFELSGRSEQEAREGYNLLNVPSNFEITSSQNNRIVPISLKANTTYTIQADEIDTDNISTSPNFLFRLRYNNEDVDNIRVLLRAKKISFTTMGNVDTVWIYSGTNYNESATTNTTFKNLMIYEGTAEKSYEPYTGGTLSPNPDYPQEIQNVGDNINLLNKDTVDASNNLRGNALDTGRRLIANKDGTYTYGAFKLGGRELLGKTLGIHADIETTGGNPRISIFAGNSSSLTKSLLQVVLSASGTGYMTIPSNLNSELDTISAVLYVTTDASVVAGTYVDYTNLKVQVGSGKVVYSAHNCGNLGVTISNKNLYKVEKVIDDSNVPKFIFLREGNLEFTTGGVPLIIAPTTIKEKTEYTYILKCKSNVTTENNINFTGIYEDGTRELLSANKKKDTNEFIVKFKTNKEKTLAYVTQQYTNSAGATIITEGTMILEGDYLNSDEPYEIHQEKTRIFPLAEGQKLYEGSYLAEDGIHNKRKQIVLTGNENWYMITNISTTKTQVFCLNNIVNNISVNHVTFKSNYFVHKKWIDAIYVHLDEPYMSQTDTTNIYLNIYKSLLSSVDATGFKSWLKSLYDVGKPVEIEYPLAEEEIIPYTQEQQEIYSQLQNLELFRGCNHITVESNVKPTIKLSYYDGELDMTDYKYNLQFKKHMQEM